MFYQVSKHLEVGLKKNSAAPRFLTNSVFGNPDETLLLVFDILHSLLKDKVMKLKNFFDLTVTVAVHKQQLTFESCF